MSIFISVTCLFLSTFTSLRSDWAIFACSWQHIFSQKTTQEYVTFWAIFTHHLKVTTDAVTIWQLLEILGRDHSMYTRTDLQCIKQMVQFWHLLMNSLFHFIKQFYYCKKIWPNCGDEVMKRVYHSNICSWCHKTFFGGNLENLDFP